MSPIRPSAEALPASYLLDIKHPNGSPLTHEELGKLIRRMQPDYFQGMSEEEVTHHLLPHTTHTFTLPTHPPHPHRPANHPAKQSTNQPANQTANQPAHASLCHT